MQKKKKSIYLFLSILLFALSASPSFAIVPTLEIAKYFLTDMSNIINTKDPYKIAQFFNYYASKESSFVITIYEVDEKNMNGAPKSSNTINLNRAEYIKRILDDFNNTQHYYYKLNPDDIKIEVQDNTAIIFYHTETSFISFSRVGDILSTDETLTSTNCNISVTITVSDPHIEGMHCITKHAVKILTSNKQP